MVLHAIKPWMSVFRSRVSDVSRLALNIKDIKQTQLRVRRLPYVLVVLHPVSFCHENRLGAGRHASELEAGLLPYDLGLGKQIAEERIGLLPLYHRLEHQQSRIEHEGEVVHGIERLHPAGLEAVFDTLSLKRSSIFHLEW